MNQKLTHGPKKVRVTVLDNEELPATIDLKEEIRTRVEAPGVEQVPAAAEPEWKERYLRLAADLDNSKKRLAQSYKLQAEQEKERLLADFLEVADSLERALAYADENSGNLVEGIKTIQRQFQQTLAKHEVRPFDAYGQPFDPKRHEAISVLRQPNLPPNTVAQSIQTGYTIGDRVLRPARVVVTGDR